MFPDGGTFGGIKNEPRPSGIHSSYKRTLAEGNTQNATLVAYSWIETFKQKDVPGNIVLMGSPTSVEMIN